MILVTSKLAKNIKKIIVCVNRDQSERDAMHIVIELITLIRYHEPRSEVFMPRPHRWLIVISQNFL